MPTWLGIAAALTVLLALGHGALAVIASHARLYWYERWATALLLGTGVATFTWFVCSPAYGLISPLRLLTGGALGAVVALGAKAASGARSMGRLRVPVATDRLAPAGLAEAQAAKVGALSAIDLLLAGVLVLEFAALLMAALHTPLGWDAIFNFEMKARLAFEHVPRGQLPLAYLSDASRNWSHPRYPLLVPFAEFWIYSWLGRVDQSAIKILFPLFYFSLVALLCGAVRRTTNRRVAWLAGIALGLLPPLTLQPGAASGYADVPLAAAAGGAICFVFLALKSGNVDALWLGAALSAVAVWTKTEGLILAAAIALSGIVAMSWLETRPSVATIPLRQMMVLLWLPLLAAAPWLIVLQLHGVPQQGDFQQVSARAFFENLDRIPMISALVGRELLRPGHWALIWPGFFVALALMIYKRRSNAADWFLAASVVIPLTVYGGLFLFSAWTDVREHIGWSLARLLVPLAPIALLFTIRSLGDRPGFEAGEWA
jgi:hypothetical protein